MCLAAPDGEARRLHCGSRHIEYAYRGAASGVGKGFKGRSLRVKRLEFFRTTAIALECFKGALWFRIRFPPAAGEIPCAFLGDESCHIGWRVAKNEPYLVRECRFALRGFEFFSRKRIDIPARDRASAARDASAAWMRRLISDTTPSVERSLNPLCVSSLRACSLLRAPSTSLGRNTKSKTPRARFARGSTRR